MALLLALALGCSGGEPPAPPVLASALDSGWVASLVASPDAFGQLMTDQSRDGWVALHGADWPAAAARLDGLPAARAELELALLNEDLARVAAATWPRLSDAWVASDPAVAASPLPLLAALAQASAGQDDAARARVADRSDGDRALVEAVLTQQAADLAVDPDDPLQACVTAHIAVRTGDAEALPVRCPTTDPLLQVDGRSFYDPMGFSTTAHQHRQRADRIAGGALGPALQAGGLEGLLFSGWWSRADLDAALADDPTLAAPFGAGPTLAALSLPDAGDADEPQGARERVRALDQALDAWEQARHDAADADGRALLDDLRLVALLRSRILLGWARAALAEDRPHQATAYLQLAHDVEAARQLGPTNPPGLFALQAEAALRTGRTREALDALSVLEPAYPSVRALDETAGDLAVLAGMGRHGDSKEN